MSQRCRLCNKPAYETQAVQVRVNELGVEGMWECRPICGAQLGTNGGMIAAVAGTFDEPPLFGLPLADCNDVDFLRNIAEKLWDLLDDIDTTSDMMKSNDVAYRKRVERIQSRRGEFLVSDGYKLFLLPAQGKSE